MKMVMQARFSIYGWKDGNPVVMKLNEEACLSVGGFEFVVDDKVIPFDFNASACQYKDGIYEYESGYGPFSNDFEIPEDFYDEIKESGVNPKEVSAKFLSGVSDIREFYLNFEDEKLKERDNSGKDIWIEQYGISFIDRKTSDVYQVSDRVIQKYNLNARRSAMNKEVV